MSAEHLWWIQGRLDGAYVSGFETGATRKVAIRRCRDRLGLTRTRGRRKNDEPKFEIEEAVKADA